jgi:nicotinamidase-related amidase
VDFLRRKEQEATQDGSTNCLSADTSRASERVSGGDVTLLIIDPQNDFHPGGSLAIQSAGEDARRIASFIRTRTHDIDRIVITLDSHQRTHIAHAIFWVDADGYHPPPFTIISKDDVKTMKWRPKNPDNQQAADYYAQKLEEGGRFQICIWPEHCIIGSPGHNVHPEIQEAVSNWAETHMKEVLFVWKGQNCLTEMYSALRADVPIVDDPRTHLNVNLIRTLRQSKRLFVCGQALSHCVNFTVRDLVEHYDEAEHDSRLGTITILRDGTSPVPGFEADGECFLRDMVDKGVCIANIVSELG